LRLKTTKKPYREPIYGGDGEEIGYYLMNNGGVVVEEHYYEDDA